MKSYLTSAILLTASSLVLAGCGQHGTASKPGGGAASASSDSVHGILGSLRPKADQATLDRLHAADQAAKAKADALAAEQMPQQAGLQSPGWNVSNRNLPRVSQDPIAPPAEEVAKDTPVFTSVQDNSSAAQANQIASAPPSYGSYGAAVPPPPPGALGGSLVPPPPPVTLSTQANVNPGAIGNPYDNPYANPYLNQYQIPYQQMVPAGRPSGSPFGSANGGRSADGDDDRAAEKKKNENFVPITPTGMEPRSTYKQRDDLKVLWKGAVSSTQLQEVMSDGKFADQVRKIDVGLPNETTKGAFNINQPMVDRIFRGPALDRRIIAPVKKLESDVAHAYYGYVYTYNRFALSEQTLAAQKQEVSVAESPVEQQRAAADVARAQSEVESARDDMRSAESELASVAGATAARCIIGKVSGVTPTLESLASSGPNDAAAAQRRLMSKMTSPVTSLFHFGHGKNEKQVAQAQPDNKEPVKVSQAKLPPAKKDKDKEPKKSKENKKERLIAGDLSPAPSASSPPSPDNSNAGSERAATSVASHGGQDGISFELKSVNVQPRKSILTVSIRNSGANSYSFSPELFSISDGSQKLSEAAVRADFDQTMVQPNGEVKGTITIFGRPWNDKLAVVLSDGSKMIQLRR